MILNIFNYFFYLDINKKNIHIFILLFFSKIFFIVLLRNLSICIKNFCLNEGLFREFKNC